MKQHNLDLIPDMCGQDTPFYLTLVAGIGEVYLNDNLTLKRNGKPVAMTQGSLMITDSNDVGGYPDIPMTSRTLDIPETDIATWLESFVKITEE